MINKKNFIFNTLAEACRYKVGADPGNTTYRLGSFAADAQIFQGTPDISYYSQILIRETNQMWLCGQFWMNDVDRNPDNDLVTERAERIAADDLLRHDTEALKNEAAVCAAYREQETSERTEADAELTEYLENQQAAIASLGLRIDGLAGKLITM